MSFVDVNVFGILIAPIMPMMLIALATTMLLRWIAVALGFARWIWHPALFEFSVFLIILSATVLIAGALKLHA